MMAASAAPEYGPRAGVLAPLPSCERGVAAVTAVSPDGKLLIYCNGANVVVRELARPALAYVYPEHAHAVKCAKFSPSGKYVASGDASGKVRIWAWTQAEHSLKFECPCGENVEDVFFITDADGGPITDPDAVARLQRDIRSALDGGETRQESRSRSAR